MNTGQDGGNDAVLPHKSSPTTTQTVVIPDQSDDIYSAYANCISTRLNDLGDYYNDNDNNYYFLYDITRDNSPELWIVIMDASSNIDKGLFVYTFDKGCCKNIYSAEFNVYTDISIGDSCVICEHGGWATGGGWDIISMLTYDGKKIIETIIKHTETLEENGYETTVKVDKTNEYLPLETKSPKTAKLYEAHKLTTGYFR